jgi:hypothetical protein
MLISEQEDARFKSAVEKSRAEVSVVASHLERRGFKTEITPQRIRDKFEERAEYGDDADLFVFSRSGNKLGIEVKGRLLRFSSAEDFPYPTLFVDRVAKADKSSVFYYISVNVDKTVIAVIRASTKDRWIKTEKYDHVKNHPLWVYECPKELVKFVKI